MTPLDLMYGCVEDERYEKFVRLCRDAMKRFHVSLRYDTVTLSPGQEFTALPFVHDDDGDPNGASVKITATDDRGQNLGVFDGEVKLTVPEGIRSFTLTCEAVSDEKRDLNRYLFFVSAEGLPLCSADAVLKFVEVYKSENGIK